MQAQLKNIDGPEYAWASYQPEFVRNFCIWLSLSKGARGNDEVELFQLCVCTSVWLEELVSRDYFMWGGNLFIVDRFDRDKIEYELEKLVHGVSGENWGEVRSKLSKFMRSEYEGMHSK